jgi:hypothetical protein
MTEQAATLADFTGSNKSDQGPVLFHFKADQRFSVAIPADQLIQLIASAIIHLPRSMDDTGKPAASNIIALPASSAASFYQPDGSMVLGLSLATGGQVAFQLSAALRETLTQTLVAAQASLAKAGG